MSWYGELELRNRLFQEDHARDCHEIEELSRICCEETDQARQVRIEELSMQQQKNPATVSQMMAQIRDLQKKVNSLPCRDSGLPRNTQNCTGMMGNVFERPPVQEGQPSTFFHNSKNLASSSQLLGPDTADTARKRENGMKRESLNTPIQSPHFQSRSGMLNHTCGTDSHHGMVDYPRTSIAELNLGKLPVPMEFQGWKTNFRSESCLKTAHPQVTMHWIKEVEIAKSIDELKTSRSIVGRTDFPDFDMLDAMLASALKKILITQVPFRKSVSVEEQRAEKYDRFSRGRQLTYMIYEYLRAAGAYEAVQGLSDLFTMSLQNDDVQDFDVRWDHALLTVSEIPSDAILEGLYKSNLQNSFQLQTMMPLYDQEVARNNGEPTYQQ